MAEQIPYGHARLAAGGKVHGLYDPDRLMCSPGARLALQPTEEPITCGHCLRALAAHERAGRSAQLRDVDQPEPAELQLLGWLALDSYGAPLVYTRDLGHHWRRAADSMAMPKIFPTRREAEQAAEILGNRAWEIRPVYVGS